MKQSEIPAASVVRSGQAATWDGAFFWRVAVFALIPLLKLIAVKFPDVGGVLLKWIDPSRNILR